MTSTLFQVQAWQVPEGMEKAFVPQSMRIQLGPSEQHPSGMPNPRRRSVTPPNAQDWPRWCREKWVDFVCPMDYTKSADLFDGIVRHQMEVTGKVKVYPGIGLSCWPDDGEDIRRFGEHIEIVRKLGLSGFTVFALGSRSLKAFPAFR